MSRLLPRGRTAAWIVVTSAAALVAIRLNVEPAPIDAGISAVEPLLARDAPGPGAANAAARFCALLLAEADRQLAAVETIHAVFHKRERIDGQLQQTNVMDLKVRRSPSSVYLRWREPNEGREIAWREDLHDGQIVVRAGGWRRKVVPLLKIDPLSDRAMQYSRRPVTSIGLWNFNARLRKFVEEDATRGPWRAELREDVAIAGRTCYGFTFHAQRSAGGPQHQWVVVYVDQELGLPIACELFGWPTSDGSDAAPLEESYAFENLELNRPVSDADFDLSAQGAEVARKP